MVSRKREKRVQYTGGLRLALGLRRRVSCAVPEAERPPSGGSPDSRCVCDFTGRERDTHHNVRYVLFNHNSHRVSVCRALWFTETDSNTCSGRLTLLGASRLQCTTYRTAKLLTSPEDCTQRLLQLHQLTLALLSRPHVLALLIHLRHLREAGSQRGHAEKRRRARKGRRRARLLALRGSNTARTAGLNAKIKKQYRGIST